MDGTNNMTSTQAADGQETAPAAGAAAATESTQTAATAETKDTAATNPETTTPAAGQQAGTESTDAAESFLAKLEERYQKDLAAAIAEEKKKAAMNEEERVAYEKEQQAKELEAKEKAIALRELKADTKELLVSKEIPVEFLDMLVGADLKATEANIDAFKKQFDLAVQAQVEKRLVGKTPGTSTGALGNSATATLEAEIDKYMD